MEPTASPKTTSRRAYWNPQRRLVHVLHGALEPRWCDTHHPKGPLIHNDALADNESAREVMQDGALKLMARELADRIKAKASLD